jgi:hypothetical protein
VKRGNMKKFGKRLETDKNNPINQKTCKISTKQQTSQYLCPQIAEKLVKHTVKREKTQKTWETAKNNVFN